MNNRHWGGTYKLSAVRQPGDEWVYKLKLSEQAIKVGYPGILQVRRYHTDSELLGDAIFDEPTGLDSGCTLVDPLDPTRRKNIAIGTPYEDLLIPIFRADAAFTIPLRWPIFASARARNWTDCIRACNALSIHINILPVSISDSMICGRD